MDAPTASIIVACISLAGVIFKCIWDASTEKKKTEKLQKAASKAVEEANARQSEELIKLIDKRTMKNSIETLILMDEFRMSKGLLPKNQVQVQESYDIYHQAGGNGTVTAEKDRYYDICDYFQKYGEMPHDWKTIVK